MAVKVKQPCAKDCPNRSAECHAHCEVWKEYEIKRNQGYIDAGKEKAFNQQLNDIDNRRSARVHNWRNGRTK